MLSLKLKSGDYLTIGENITIQVFKQAGSAFCVEIQAPREIPILRGELHERLGERPEGLLPERPRSPARRRYDEKRRDGWPGGSGPRRKERSAEGDVREVQERPD